MTTNDQTRLRRAAAAALERVQVGDYDEAEAILEQVITLAGEYVPRGSLLAGRYIDKLYGGTD